MINRCDLGDLAVWSYLEREAIPVVAEIPFERALSEAYAAGELAVRRSRSLQQALVKLSELVAPPRQEAA